MKPNPWSTITRPARKGMLTAMRISPDHPHEVFRTRDNTGACGISITFKGEVELPSTLPRLQGITVWAGGDPAQLRLTLQAEADWEPFHALSEDLTRSCAEIADSQSALHAVLTRLERWQKLLARDKSGLLSDQEVRGLFGELTFLNDELIPRFGTRAVNFWNGPDGSPQDFAIGTIVVEIKTRTGTGPSKVKISSPEQLWPSLPSMYLGVYFLVVNDREGLSLNVLVNRMRSKFEGGPFQAAFEAKLDAAGFLDLPEYEVPTLFAAQFDNYQVRAGFPSIAPSSVPEGITHLNYDLSLDHCRPFEAAIPWQTIGE